MTCPKVVSLIVANNLTSRTPVILIHGLYETTWYMKILANRLSAQGFDSHLFRYYSLKDPMIRHSERLARFIGEHDLSNADGVHLVGHSLGGLVIRQFLYDNQQKVQPSPIGRVVTLGTPHLGSTVAHYVKRLTPKMINNAFDTALDGHCPPLIDGVALGAIAGVKPQGLGKPFLTHHQKFNRISNTNLDNPLSASQLDIRHDGTVYVFETKLPNTKDHIILPVSHTGMLFNDTVAQQVGYFLKNGVFEHGKL